MKRTIKYFILKLSLVLLLGSLAGCKTGWLRDRSGDYVDEPEPASTLKVPNAIKAGPFSEEYHIPAH